MAADDLKGFVPDAPVASADGFVPDPPARGALAEIGTGAVRGLYSGVRGAGAILQTPAERSGSEPGIVSRAGQAMEQFGKAGEERNAAQPDTHGGATNFLSTAAESLGSSIPVVAGAMAGGAAGSVVPGAGNIVGAAAGGAGAAALQTWHEKHQEALQKGLKDDAARDYADKSAGLSAAAMGALSAIPGGGAAARAALGAGEKTAAKAGAAVVEKQFLPEMGKQAAGIVAGNTALGVGQAAAQAKVDEGAGLKGPSAWEAAKAAAMPSLAGSVGFLPLGALHAHHEAADAAKYKAALENGDAHPLARARAANAVYESMKKVDPDAADAWKANALEAMQRKAPIGLTDEWTQPHASLFPELKALSAPKPVIAGAPQDGQPPSDPSVDQRAQNLYAARDAEEARRTAAMEQPQGLLPRPGEVAMPMGEGGEPASDPNAQGNADAVYAARDAEEQRRQGSMGQFTTPLLEDRNAPEGGPAPLEPNPGPFSVSQDLNTDRLARQNDELWRQRDAVSAQRESLAQHIEQQGEGGTLSGAAAQAVRSGAADEAMGKRTTDGEQTAAKPAKPEEVDPNVAQWAKTQDGVSLREAQERANLLEQTANANGEQRPYSVVQHPDGGYFAMPFKLAPAGSEGLRTAKDAPAQERQMPLERGAADARAKELTNQYGVEHEVVPHPLAREKFTVQPKDAAKEQPQEQNDAVRQPEAGGVLQREPQQAGEAGGERGRVEQSVQGQEAPGPRAYGDGADPDAGVFQTPVERNFRRLTAEPNVLQQDRTGAHKPDTQQARDIYAALKHIESKGGDLTRLKNLTGIHVGDPTEGGLMSGALAAYYPESRGIVISPKTFEMMRTDPKGSEKLARIIDHEAWHHADFNGRNFISSTDPRFEIGEHDGTAPREAKGAVAQEALRAFQNTENPFHRYLEYPMDLLDKRDEALGVGDPAEAREIIQNEMFAQLGVFFNHYPDVMRKWLPKAYNLFKEFHESQRLETGGHVTDHYQRNADAERGRGVPAGSSGAQEGRAGDATLGGASTDEHGQPRRAAGRALGAGRDAGRGRAGEAQRGDDEARSAPLEGLPATSPGPSPRARDVAEQYMKEAGLPYDPPSKYVAVDQRHAKRVADAYEAMKHDPENPEVQRAYAAMIKETLAQWQAIKKSGLKVTFTDAEHPYPYKVPSDVFRDVNDNNHMWVFSTDDGYGSSEKVDTTANPMLTPTDEVIGGHKLVANDVFRIVHDYFGHIKEGVGFRANGEENAWRLHSAMYSPEARRALTSETRGQNSWVNWGPHGEKNRTASQTDTEYAPQKTGLMPKEFVEDNYGPTGRETVSTRNATAVKREVDPMRERTDVGYDALQKDHKLFEHNVALMHEYPNFARKTALKEPKQLAERMIKQMVDNLRWLHDRMPAEIRQRAKLWYDGANRIAHDWSKEYDVSHRAASGMLAVLSPQKDWFMNVSLARRVLDTLQKQKNTAWSKEMTGTAERILDLDKPSMRAMYDAIKGKTLGELTDAREKAVWVRLYDEAHNDRSYPVIHPEGDVGDLARNANGNASKVAWGDFGAIAKAVSIHDDQSLANIHNQLGVEHKVRNFYNNIVDPTSKDGHVTIDTHAVAAALLRPLSGGSTEVLHNFGTTVPAERGIGNTKNSSVLGSSGTYGIYAEAYRRAAKEVGLLPREMQSITWEAVRGLFAVSFKQNKKNVANIEHIWQDYAKGKYDLDETRTRLEKAAGGITLPEWVSHAGLDGGARRGDDAGELPRAGLRQGRGAGDGAGAAPAIPKGRALGKGASFDLHEEPRPTENVAPITHAKDMPEWVRALPAEDREALRKAGVWVQKQTLKDRWQQYKQDAGLKVLQGTVDQFRPVLERIGKYPYQLLRMASSSGGALEQSLKSGHVELNDYGALQIKKGTKGLLDTLKPLGAETDRFLAWVAGNRAARLMAEGREHNFTPDEIARLQRMNGVLQKGDEWKGVGSRTMAYASALKDWNAYSKSILDIAEKSGLIDAEGRKQWEHEFYVPFYRQAEDAKTFEGGNISGMVNKQAFKKLKGGQEELKDLLANSLGNWAHLLDSSMRNNAAWQTLQHAEDKGIAERIKEHEAGKGDVFVMQDGKKQYYRVTDPLVLDSISSLSATPFKGPVMKALSNMKHILTVGTTMSPVFRVRHTIREQITALAANDTTNNFVKNWIDGFKYSSKDNPDYANMHAGGAFMSFAAHDGESAAQIKRVIAEGVDKTSVLDSPGKVKAMFEHAYDWWKETGERSDSITRANIYRQTYDKMTAQGMPAERAHFEASYAARDVMDFGLRGTWPAVRMLTQVVPFMNARLQGIYKLGRGAADNPQRFAAVIGGITLATIALSLANRGDKEIENLPDTDHDNNWIFRVGDKVFRIPKPFEVGALATVVDRALHVALDGFKPSDREEFVRRLWPIIGAQLNLNPVPQAAWPAMQLWANKDMFRGTAIESERDTKLTPEERVGPSTSATAQLASKTMKGVLSPFLSEHAANQLTLSPEQMDFLVNAYLGWVGSHAVATADLALRPTMGLPVKPERRVDDYFLVGDFVHQLPSNQSKFVEKFYEHLADVQKAMGDLRMYQKTGQPAKVADWMVEHKQTLQLSKMYERTSSEIGKLNQRARYVQMRTESSMSAEDKRRELDRITQLKNHLTSAAEEYRARIVDRQQ